MPTHPRLGLAASLALALTFVALGSACTRSNPAVSKDAVIALGLSITAGEADNRIGKLTIAPAVALTGVEIRFQLPSECRVTAGSALRRVPAYDAGMDVEQGLGFACPAGLKDARLVVTFAATTGDGQPVSRSVEAKL